MAAWQNVHEIHQLPFIHIAINMEDIIMKTVNDIFFSRAYCYRRYLFIKTKYCNQR